MTAQRIQSFTGIMPRVNRRLLPDEAAQVAYNCLLTDGVLTPIASPLEVEDLGGTADVLTVYRMYSGETDYWLQWPYDVDVVKGPIADDTSFRVYYTSDSFEPRVTNLAMATGAAPYPDACYVLGVTPPITAPSINVVGGSGSTESRAYVYTFVTQWGEESAPSPASSVTSGYISGSWNLSAMDAAPLNSYTISNAVWAAGILTLTVNSTFGLRADETVTTSGLLPASLNDTYRVASVPGSTSFTVAVATDPGTITDTTGTAAREAPHNTSSMMKRIYRAVTTGDTTEYFYVAEIAVATTTYSDTTSAANLGEVCETIGWSMPPATLQGLQVHPSGALVGFVGNVMYMSEPLSVYAWPSAYQQVTDYGIIGLAVTGQSVVIGTSGRPYIGTGIAPESFALQKLDRPWPCLAKRSLIAVSDGVAYASPQGLVLVSPTGAVLATEQLYTQKEWALYSPDSFKAAHFDTRYYASFDTGSASGTWVFGQGVNSLSSRFPTALYSDPVTGKMYMVIDNVLYEWMGDIGTRESLDWKSKEFVVPNPVNWGAAKVDADFEMSEEEAAAAQAAYDAIIAGNATLISSGTLGSSMNGASLNRYSLNGSAMSLVPSLEFDNLTFLLYKNQELVFSKRVSDSRVFRLPAGTKYDAYSVRIQGNVPVLAVLVGTTPLALKTV